MEFELIGKEEVIGVLYRRFDVFSVENSHPDVSHFLGVSQLVHRRNGFRGVVCLDGPMDVEQIDVLRL